MNETNHTYKIIQNGQKANEQYILFITVQIQKWSTMRTSLLQTESESSYTYSLDELIAQMNL